MFFVLTQKTASDMRIRSWSSDVCSSDLFGTSEARALMPARARPAATVSKSSPIENKNTTAAASSASPMTRAPSAATVINVSIEKGEPDLVSASALRANGKTPAKIGRAHVRTPVTNTHLQRRLLLEKKK